MTGNGRISKNRAIENNNRRFSSPLNNRVPLLRRSSARRSSRRKHCFCEAVAHFSNGLLGVFRAIAVAVFVVFVGLFGPFPHPFGQIVATPPDGAPTSRTAEQLPH